MIPGGTSKRIGRDATLDEASVRNAEQRQADWRKPVSRKPRATQPEVTHVTVDPEVWAAAMKIAGGDSSRIQVRSATNVTVHNKPWRNRNRKAS